MKKIVLIGVIFLVLLFSGCTQKLGKTVNSGNPIPQNITYLEEKYVLEYGFEEQSQENWIASNKLLNEYKLSPDVILVSENDAGVFITPEKIGVLFKSYGCMPHLCADRDQMVQIYRIEDSSKIKKFGPDCFHEDPEVKDLCLYKKAIQSNSIQECYKMNKNQKYFGSYFNLNNCVINIASKLELSENKCNQIKLTEDPEHKTGTKRLQDLKTSCLYDVAIKNNDPKFCEQIAFASVDGKRLPEQDLMDWIVNYSKCFEKLFEIMDKDTLCNKLKENQIFNSNCFEKPVLVLDKEVYDVNEEISVKITNPLNDVTQGIYLEYNNDSRYKKFLASQFDKKTYFTHFWNPSYLDTQYDLNPKLPENISYPFFLKSGESIEVKIKRSDPWTYRLILKTFYGCLDPMNNSVSKCQGINQVEVFSKEFKVKE